MLCMYVVCMCVYVHTCMYMCVYIPPKRGYLGVPELTWINRYFPWISWEKRVENGSTFSRVFDFFFPSILSPRDLYTYIWPPPQAGSLINSSFGTLSRDAKWDAKWDA
jgi:hypothetical protein